MVFVWTLYRILKYKYTPYSGIYAATYIGAHAIYNGCPITSAQNYLLTMAGKGSETVDNIFLRTELREFELPLRALVLLCVLVLFYTSFKQFQQLNVKPKDYLSYWKENSFNKQTAESKEQKDDDDPETNNMETA